MLALSYDKVSKTEKKHNQVSVFQRYDQHSSLDAEINADLAYLTEHIQFTYLQLDISIKKFIKKRQLGKTAVLFCKFARSAKLRRPNFLE